MKKVYYLKTCDTCKRILKIWNLPENYQKQEIKANPITAKDLELLYPLAGSYEALINKRAQKYKAAGLKDKNLTEADYKALLLEHYTFLKRPVLVIDNAVFIGNSKNTIEVALKALNNEA